jgi:indolepyruvate ferredoxin oxidoreductase
VAAIAALPMDIKGYGHVKDAAVERYRAALASALAALDAPNAGQDAPLRALS